MAISTAFRERILSELSPQWRTAYESGEIDDNFLETLAARNGISAPADFSNVRGGVSTTEEVRKPRRELTSLDQSPALSGFREVAGRLGTAADIAGEAGLGGLKASAGGAGYAMSEGALPTPGGLPLPLQGIEAVLSLAGMDQATDVLRRMDPSRSASLDSQAMMDLYQRGTQERAGAVQRAREERPLGETLSVGVANVAGSPSSLASLVGGPAAAVPFVDVFGQEYTAARAAGATHAEAMARALPQAGAEGVLEAIPLGIGKTAKWVPKGDLARFATRVGGNVLQESVTEGATSVVQTELDRLLDISNVGSEALQKFAQSNVPQDAATYGQQVWESMVAGGLGGGAISSPFEAMRVVAERGKEVADNLRLAGEWGAREKGILTERATAAEQARVQEEQRVAQEAEVQKRRARLDPETRAMAQQRLRTYKGRLEDVQAEILQLQEAMPTQDQLQEREALGEGMAEMPEVSQFDIRRLQSARDSRRNLIDAIGQIENTIREDDLLAGEELKAGVDEALLTERREGARKEADQRLQKRQEDLIKKVRRDHGRQRAGAIRGFEQQAAALPEDQRSDFLADKIGEWDEQNAVERVVAEAQAKTRNVQPAPTVADPMQQRQLVREQKPDVTDEQIDEAVEASQPDGMMTVEQLLAANEARKGGLASVTPEPNAVNDLTMQDVMASLRDTLGKGDSRVLNKLMRDGNLVVVSDESFIPARAEAVAGAAGFYDGKTTYIVANRLDKDNIVGSMLDVAAHEVKHAADVTGKITLGGFIGKDNNKNIVKSIEALGKQDANVARLIEHAKANSTNDTYELELPAYFIQYAREARSNQTLVGRVAGNIVSAVRTAAKGLTGNADVNLKDVAYLSDRLLSEAATKGERLEGGIVALPMIVGRGARNFAAGEMAGQTYQGRVDRMDRWEIPDINATITTDDETLAELLSGTPLPLGEVLNHERLYAEYPDLATDYKIAVKEAPGYGYYDEDIKTVVLNPLVVRGDKARMRRIVLHEVQHAIQAREGFVPGANMRSFMDMGVFKRRDELGKKLEDLVNSLPYGEALRTLPIDKNRAWRSVLSQTEQDTGRLPLVEHPAMFLSEGFAEFSRDPAIKALGKQYAKASQDYQDAYNDAEAERHRAYRIYVRDYGETEARNTELRSNWTEENLRQTMPERTMGIAGPEPARVPVEATIDTTRYIGRQEEIPPEVALASVPFRDRVAAARSKVDTSSGAYRALVNMFSAFGGLGRELGVKLEDSKNWSVKFSNRAANYDRRLSRAINVRAKERNVDRKVVANEIHNELERIAGLPLDRRESALLAYVRNNEDLRVLIPLMSDINQMSRTLLDQYLRSHPNPTPAQLKLMNQFHQNAWKYSTRLYEVFQGKAGSKLAERLKKEYYAAEKELKAGRSVPAPLKESYERWNNAAKYLIENDINIPADLSKTRQGHLDNLYQMHIPVGMRVADTIGDVKAVLTKRYRDQGMTISDAERAVRDQMIQELEAVRDDVTEEIARGKANQIIEAMLGLTDTGAPIVDYYRGAKQDRTILQTREDIPDAIRDLFGQITDPAVRLAVTLAKQAELVGRNQFLMALKNEGAGKWVIHESQVGQPGSERFSQVLSGENFGMLEGWRTTPEIAAHIKDGLEMYSDLDQAITLAYSSPRALAGAVVRGASDLLMKTASGGKLATIVFDAYNGILNAAGSTVLLLQNGVYKLSDITDAGKVGGMAIINTVYSPEGELSEDFEDAVRYGLLDSARAQEIRRTPFTHVQRLLQKQTLGSQAWQYVLGAKNVGVEAFAMTDAWVKIAAFKARTRTLREYYAAAGIDKTDAEIKSEAADVIKDTNIGFSRTPGLVRTAERLGAVTFMPYFWSVYRSIIYSGRQAAKDWETAMNAPTPEAKRIMTNEAIRRTAGLTASTVIFTSALKAIAGVLAGDDEEKIEAMKKLMFEDTRFADLIYTGKDEAGVPTFIRLSRVDANGPVTDLLRIAINDEMDTATKIKAGKEMITGMVFQNRATVSAGRAAYAFATGDKVKDRETRAERIMPATADRLEQAVTALNRTRSLEQRQNVSETVQEALSAFVPGWFDAFDPSNTAGTGEGGKRATEAALARLAIAAGGKLDKADPQRAMAMAGNALKEIRKVGRKDVEEARKAGLTNIEVLHRLNTWAEQEQEAALKVQEVYLAMLDSGMTRAQALAVVKDSRAVEKQDMDLLIGGRNFSDAEEWGKRHSRLLSEKATEGLNRISDQKLSEADRARAKKERDEFLQKMKALGYKVQEE